MNLPDDAEAVLLQSESGESDTLNLDEMKRTPQLSSVLHEVRWE